MHRPRSVLRGGGDILDNALPGHGMRLFLFSGTREGIARQPIAFRLAYIDVMALTDIDGAVVCWVVEPRAVPDTSRP